MAKMVKIPKDFRWGSTVKEGYYYAPAGDPFMLTADLLREHKIVIDGEALKVNIQIPEETVKNMKVFANSLRAAALGLEQGRDRIAKFGAELFQQIVILRLASTKIPKLVVQTAGDQGGGRETSDLALAQAAEEIEQELRSPVVKIDANTYGFASRKQLDKIKITSRGEGYSRRIEKNTESLWSEYSRKGTSPERRKALRYRVEQLNRKQRAGPAYRGSNSPFDIAWMILQYGTGQYARPTRNMSDSPTKLGLPKGRWYWNPNKRAPIIWGQKHTYFLYDPRKTSSRLRDDLRRVSARIQEALEDYLQRAIGADVPEGLLDQVLTEHAARGII